MVVRIRCMTLEGGFVTSNSYKCPSGRRYQFHKGTATLIDNREDADYFLNCGKGTLFKKVTKTGEIIEELKKALSEVAKELPLPKKKEDDVSGFKCDKEGCTDEKPHEHEEDKEEPKEEVKKYTYNEIKAENKKWQIDKIKELGGDKIPGLEGDRINLILKLQGGV